VENTISPILEAPIDMTWSYGKEVSCQSLSRYIEVLDEEFFCHRVMAIVGMKNELGDRKQIKSCVRFLQASNVENDCGPLNKSLLYLVEDNATAKKFAKAETQENLPKITELAHKINVYVIMQSSWTPMLITQDNNEEIVQSWKNYIGSDITQGDANTLAFWLNTYFPN